MILILQLIFIVLLSMILLVLYRNEVISTKEKLQMARAEGYWRGRDRRQHTRFKEVMEVLYRIEKKAHLRNNCKTIDVSEGGLKVLLDEKLPIGAILDMKIAMPNSKRIAELEGEVMWTEDLKTPDPSGKRLFCSGIRFSGVKPSDGVELVEYLRSLSESVPQA